MGTNRNQYIHNVASTVLGQLGGVAYAGHAGRDEYEPELPDYPQTFWNLYGHKVMDVVGKMGSSARGRILACGVAHSGNGMVAYHEVNDGLCTAEVSGEELLTLLASYVVAAAIVDIFRQGVQTMRNEEQRREDEFSLGMAAYIHGDPNHIGATR